MTTMHPGIQGLHADLLRPSLRRAVVSTVCSRVPRDDADDVVQQVFCAALASKNVPEEPARRARWVTGIARHKVADYYRARRPEPVVADDAATPAVAFEAREILTNVLEDVRHDEQALQTLQWIVREHQGERLTDIAREERLSAAAVRQRVSRLRRGLRAKWLPLVAALATTVALVVARPWQDPMSHAVGGLTSSPTLRAAQGDWRVVSVDADDAVDAATRALGTVTMAAARVGIAGDHIAVTTPSGHFAGRLRVIETGAGEADVIVTRADSDVRVGVRLVAEDRLVVEVADGAWRGRITLER